MRWKAKDYTSWHSHFTWTPIQINGEWVWMERVLRKGRSRIQPMSKSGKWNWEFLNSELDLIKKTEEEATWANEAVNSAQSGPSAMVGSNAKGR